MPASVGWSTSGRRGDAVGRTSGGLSNHRLGARGGSGDPSRLGMGVDYVEHIGQEEGAAERMGAERLGKARSWREVEPYWQTDEPTAWEAARQRAARMRDLLGVKRWWLAIAIECD